MAGNIELIAKRCFRQAVRVTDRFHVQQLVTEALQEMRIKHRWEALDAENDVMDRARKAKLSFRAEVLANGDTLNSCWQDLDMYSTRSLRIGQMIKESGKSYFSNDILISNKCIT